MVAPSKAGITLRELSPDDTVSGLSFGNPAFAPLKSFLKKCAKGYHKANTAKTYVLVEDSAPKKVIGYVTLVCSQIQIDAPDDVGEYPYEDFPAVKIARLAVDGKQQRGGLGTKLIDWSIAVTITKIMPHVGCRFIAVDSKQESIEFYEANGFRLLDTAQNKLKDNPVMFIDIGKLAAA